MASHYPRFGATITETLQKTGSPAWAGNSRVEDDCVVEGSYSPCPAQLSEDWNLPSPARRQLTMPRPSEGNIKTPDS